jgi:hypothetical protein
LPDEPDPGTPPRRAEADMSFAASLLDSVGGLIMGIGAVVAVIYAWRSFGQEIFWSFALPATLGFGSGTVLLGWLLTVIARSKVRRRSRRWQLWAQILLHFGMILSFSLPLFVYGFLFFGEQVAAMNGSSPPFAVGPIHSWRLSMTVLLGGIPFVVGLLFIVPAIVWGRRNEGPDLPAVFG